MMPNFRMNSRITPGPVRSLITMYERTLGRTTPATAGCTPSQTPGKTS